MDGRKLFGTGGEKNIIIIDILIIFIINMSDICDNMYSVCNSIIIQIAWFMEQVLVDLNKVKEEIIMVIEEPPSAASPKTLLKEYKYVSGYDEKIEEYASDEDWMEAWDKV